MWFAKHKTQCKLCIQRAAPPSFFLMWSEYISDLTNIVLTFKVTTDFYCILFNSTTSWQIRLQNPILRVWWQSREVRHTHRHTRAGGEWKLCCWLCFWLCRLHWQSHLLIQSTYNATEVIQWARSVSWWCLGCAVLWRTFQLDSHDQWAFMWDMGTEMITLGLRATLGERFQNQLQNSTNTKWPPTTDTVQVI